MHEKYVWFNGNGRKNPNNGWIHDRQKWFAKNIHKSNNQQCSHKPMKPLSWEEPENKGRVANMMRRKGRTEEWEGRGKGCIRTLYEHVIIRECDFKEKDKKLRTHPLGWKAKVSSVVPHKSLLPKSQKGMWWFVRNVTFRVVADVEKISPKTSFPQVNGNALKV